ncbi:ankyrin repeat domain-containing [Stylonychia lemnae]|uniref:Ankyrin repeat domain-containing n=1 Tax=Stylonychia lemnae TaxID=5949 RepID=A0A078ABT9_STYLE|nr:ankyrin repeat domain-containing [Stylonychia lemnae]|eukprot:CDW79057.1 ankyrin repeat domain-containing [Stylonychia lemnae]
MKATESVDDKNGKFPKLSEESFANFFNPSNPVATIRNMTGLGNKDLIAGMIDKVNMLVDGGELIQAAVSFNQPKMLEYYIEKGAKVDMPPETVGKLYTDTSKHQEYRKAPFIIQAAAIASWDVFNILLKKGCKITEQGYIGLSKKRKNQVISNVIGAAAYNGRAEILKNLVGKHHSGLLFVDHPSTEKLDFTQKGTLTKEFTGYTPLMLAVAGGGQNLECVKLLIQAKADTGILDPLGNTILHIAASYQNNEVLEYLLKNSQTMNVFERNQKGETPLSIVQERKDDKAQKAMRLLEEYAQWYGDQTKEKTDQLLNDLLEEENKEKQKKAKNKEKNKRQKIRQLAQKEGVSYEEMEKKLGEEKEQKKQEEERKKKEDDERALIEAEEERRIQAERIRLLQEEENRRQAKKVKFGEVEYSDQQQQQQQAQPKVQEKRREEPRQVDTQQPEYMQTSFAHLKAKKPAQTEKPVVKETVVEKVAPVVEEKKKDVPQENLMNRKQRKQIERQKELEQRRKDNRQKEDAQEEKALNKGANEDDEDTEDEATQAASNQVWGLESELKLKTLANQKARRRLRKKMEKQQKEEQDVRDKLKKLAEDKEAELKRQQEEEEAKLRAEEEEKNKKYTYFKPQDKPQYRVKTQKEQEQLQQQEQEQLQKQEQKPQKEKPQKKQKEPKVQEKMVYRPKPKAQQTVETANEDTKSQTQDLQTNTQETSQIENGDHHQYLLAKQEQQQVKQQIIESQVPPTQHQQPHQHQHEKLLTPPSSPTKLNEVTLLQQQQLQHQQFLQQQQQFMALMTPPGMPPAFGLQSNQSIMPNELIHQHLQQLQVIILQKDNDIHLLNSKMVLLEQQLQAKALEQNSEDKELKNQVNHLNDLLMKERAMTHMLNNQLLDAQRTLSDEQSRRKETDDKYNTLLNETQGRQSTTSSEHDLLDLANLELRAKERSLRDVQRKNDIYEGKNLETKNKLDLQTAQKQLADALKIINLLLEGKKQ